MTELYRNHPTPNVPDGPYREGIQHGKTLDGTDVAIIATIDRYYDRRKWGFDAGLWEHSFCLDKATTTFMIVSYHAASHQEKITTVITAVDWKNQIPKEVGNEDA